jgi:bile acid:Na+ symporter, BASS family
MPAALLDIGPPLVTVILLMTVGLELRPADFARVGDRPGLVAAGVLLPAVLLPGVAVVLIDLLHAAPLAASGLLLLVACPIGGISNTYSYLARASTALSVTLTAVSCAAAVITIPAIAFVLDVAWHRPLTYAVPLQALLGQLLVLLAPPIGIGMAVRARWPAIADRSRRMMQRVGFALLGVLLVLTFTDVGGDMQAAVASSVLLATTFILAALLLGLIVAVVARTSGADRFTLSTEFATRNVAIAMALAVSIAGDSEFALFAAIYLLCEIPIMMLIVLGFRRFRALQPV